MGMILNFLKIEQNQLDIFKEDSSKLAHRIYQAENESDPDFLDIDKSWDGIIFLLTGQSVQNASGDFVKLIFSGNLIDPNQDLGYGPAHYLNPNEVSELYAKLQQINTEQLKINFNAPIMNTLEVYPNIWDDGQLAIDYLIDNFINLRNFYADAAKKNQAIIMILN